MKFLPENKKKKNWSIAILAISVAGIIYINFLTGAPAAGPVGSAPDDFVPGGPGDPNVTAGAQGAENQPRPESAEAPQAAGTSKILPYGEKIDDSILNDPRFLKLKPVPDLTVSEEELGRSNLFSQ